MLAIDHLIWAAPDLDPAIDTLEALSGVRARLGGTHPGRGTRNALIALGPASYLEVLAPDPDQVLKGSFGGQLARLARPQLVGVMLASSDLDRAKAVFDAAGVEADGPFDAERRAPDGRTLRWRLLMPTNPPWGECTPMLIDWMDTPNPATTAPEGCRLIGHEIGHPDGDRLRSMCQALDAALDVVRSDHPFQRAIFDGPSGRFTLTGFPSASEL